jgi:hypothetical protein
MVNGLKRFIFLNIFETGQTLITFPQALQVYCKMYICKWFKISYKPTVQI